MEADEAAGLPVLIVDFEASLAEELAERMRALGYQAFTAGNPLDGLIAIEDRAPQVVVLRWRVDEARRGSVIDSDVMLRAIHLALGAPPAVIALVDSSEDASLAMQLGAKAYLMGGASGEQLVQRLTVLIEQLRVPR